MKVLNGKFFACLTALTSESPTIQPEQLNYAVDYFGCFTRPDSDCVPKSQCSGMPLGLY